jgi:hypothetical protein
MQIYRTISTQERKFRIIITKDLKKETRKPVREPMQASLSILGILSRFSPVNASTSNPLHIFHEEAVTIFTNYVIYIIQY